MSWKEPEMNHSIKAYLIRVMPLGNAPIGKYNLIQIRRSSSDEFVTNLWKAWNTQQWASNLSPTQGEVDEWLRENLCVGGMEGLLRRIGLSDDNFVLFEW